ncbi:MAG: ABC transporter ATP-binding protein [Gemmatimonadales bacterium]
MADLATLELHHLARRFGHRIAVADLSLRIESGSFHLIVGPNGSGKSTLARMAVGLLRPHGGQVLVQGGDPRVSPDARRRLGYLGHQTQLYGDLTPIDNLRFAARLAGLDAVEDRVATGLEDVGIGPERAVNVRGLSRGMAQRVAVARSLIHRPELIVWDEPLTGLDQASATRVVGLLERHRERGAAVAVISHDLGELWRPGVTVHVIQAGRLVETTSTAVPLDQFRSRYAELAP